MRGGVRGGGVSSLPFRAFFSLDCLERRFGGRREEGTGKSVSRAITYPFFDGINPRSWSSSYHSELSSRLSSRQLTPHRWKSSVTNILGQWGIVGHSADESLVELQDRREVCLWSFCPAKQLACLQIQTRPIRHFTTGCETQFEGGVFCVPLCPETSFGGSCTVLLFFAISRWQKKQCSFVATETGVDTRICKYMPVRLCPIAA